MERFEVRHNNDVWHVFDTVYYTAVDAYKSEAQAFADVCRRNEKLSA